MKTILKILASLLVLLVIIVAIAYFVMNKPMPQGTKGVEAEALANKMMEAVNKKAWDAIPYIQWTFREDHHYVWDKIRHKAEVKWEDYRVLINTRTVTGIAYSGESLLNGEEAEEAIQKAWSLFCNDSWWLNAPVKAMDPGTERSIVKLEDGSQGLKIAYSSGGVTPGDTYLWKLDEWGKPLSYQMWVSIIPVDGLEFTWEDWTTVGGGALIAQQHKSKMLEIPISNIKAGQSYESMGFAKDPFEGI